MDLPTTVTSLWIAVYAAAIAVAFIAGLKGQSEQELQPIPVEENPEA